MSAATAATAQVTIPRPDIPEGTAVYDAIMGAIEPDLTTAGAALLDEKYRDETPEQTRERAERYDRAKEEYDRRYAAWKFAKQSEVANTVKSAYVAAEHVNRGQESEVIQGLETKIQSASPTILAA